ncbi:hypothetical protein VTN00DRAFT_9622 [Thermoascus crustaceus]|uniref:uncharacterized protein n=1 Tax=Thermoascus crustaceus TaxID=5088 RepID=UPI0037423C2D
MQWRELLERNGEKDIMVIAVWARDLPGVYDAEKVASGLGYSDTGSDNRRKLRHHHDEYLVEGGIAADDYHILALFEGGGPDRDVVFECPFYTISTKIPSGFLPGKGSKSPMEDIEDKIYSHTGVRDDMKRDQLMKAISGTPYAFPDIMYMEWKRQRRIVWSSSIGAIES